MPLLSRGDTIDVMARVGFFQFEPFFADKEQNINRVLQALESVQADLIVLPEQPFLREKTTRGLERLSGVGPASALPVTVPPMKTIFPARSGGLGAPGIFSKR